MRVVKQDTPARDESPGAARPARKAAAVAAPAANDPVHDRAQRLAPSSQRTWFADAFTARGLGVEPKTAYQRSKQWCRSAGAEWVRSLDATNPSPEQGHAAVSVQVQAGQRTRLAAAFQALGHDADRQAAYRRTKAWFRSSSADWTRALS